MTAVVRGGERPTCHLVRQPGDRKVVCGQRTLDVAVAWVRWMGAHEAGCVFYGKPLPRWCVECLLRLRERTNRENQGTSL